MAIQRDKITASAEKLVAKGKIEAAIREYDRLIDENPGDVNTLNRIGDLWSRINRNDEAVKVFTKIADHYSKDGFFLKAIAIYKKINKLDPSKLDIYSKLAELYARQGLAMEAKSQYQVLADFHLKQGDPAGALVAYKRIGELDPNSINVSVKMADLYSQTGQTAQALEQYEKIGRSLLKRGMTEEAGQVYRKAVRLDPTNLSLAESAVQALSDAGDRKGAIDIIRTTLEKAPENPRLIARLGRLHLEAGETSEAREVLQKGLDANPADVSIREVLAELQLDEGDTSGAWRVLAPVVDGAISRGDTGEATTALEKIVARDPSHVEALSRLVRAYARAGDQTRELSAMTRLADAYSERGDLNEALAVVDDLAIRDRGNASSHQARARELRSRLGLAPSESEHLEISAPSSPAISFDDSSSFDLDLTLDAPDPLPPSPSPVPVAPAEGDEDINFVTEHLTEAEVFHKYGLTEKAVEHLSLITARYPGNLAARDRLVRVWMDEGDGGEVARAATEYAALLRSRNDRATLEALAADLRAHNFDGVAGSVETMASQTAAGGLQAAPPPASPDLELPELDFGDSDVPTSGSRPSAEEAASSGMDLDFGDAGDLPEIELDLDAPELEVELELPDLSPAEAEPTSFQEPDSASGFEGFSSEAPAPVWTTPGEAGAVEESEVSFEPSGSQEPTISFDTPGGEEQEISFEPAAEVEEHSISFEETASDEADFSFEPPPAVEEPSVSFESLTPDAPEISFDEPDADQEPVVSAAESPVEDVLPFDRSEGEPGAADANPLELDSPSAAGDGAEEASAFDPGSFTSEEPATEVPAEHEEIDFSDASARSEPVSESDDAWGGISVEELGEVDFYLEQELFGEAENRLQALESRFPGNAQLAARRDRLDSATASESLPSEISPLDIESELLSAMPGQTPQPGGQPAASDTLQAPDDDESGLFDDEEGFFDLAAELEQELQDDDEEVTIGEEEQSLEEIFREFKKGVEQQLDSEDYETHYNLGIAYKEMGLTDEAISEFQLASKDPRRAIECCSMLGICFLEKGMPQLAIKWYLKGLEAPEITEDEQLGLLYDLGAAYLEVGDVTNAQKAFVDIYGINSNYRDIADRLRDLEDVSR